MNILVVLEDNNGAIHRMSLEAIVAAQEISSKLKSKITVLFFIPKAINVPISFFLLKIDKVCALKMPIAARESKII